MLSLDDFGTGYCSFEYLNRFPVDVIKIDQTFIQSLGSNRLSNAVVAAIINFVRDLGVFGIAEGVETMAQYEQVASYGCDACQGYYFARPMRAAALDRLMTLRSSGENLQLPFMRAVTKD